MEDFSLIIALVSFIVGALQILLFFKLWGACNDVQSILAKFNNPISIQELVLKHSIGAPDFNEKLSNAIYVDLRRYGSINYDIGYKKWVRYCGHYGWQMPDVFVKANTYEKYKEIFG